jgi:hypothetical protein
MRRTILLVAVSIFSGTVAYAETIVCKSILGRRATFTRLTPDQVREYPALDGNKAVYRAVVDEKLSVGDVGEIREEDDRLLAFDARRSRDPKAMLKNWDGNTGVLLVVPEHVVETPDNVDRSFPANLSVYSSDLTHDENRTRLTCEID